MANRVPETASGPEDEELAGQAAAGDAAAFERLFRRHSRYVSGLLSGLLGDPEDARDAAQEVWVKARQGLAGFAGRSGFRTWLTAIAANHARDVWKVRDRLRRCLAAAEELRRWEERAARSPGEGSLDGSLMDLVAELDELPRRVVELKLEDPDRTLEEVASALAVPHHKAKYALAKARQVLARKLHEFREVDRYLAMSTGVLALARAAGSLGEVIRG